ncbi:MAG: HNH endonuclease [Halomonas sp.]|nr:HNH endonuclease [Halomonas sp.]MCC5882078.1 HNH endonuclease [Halomonas sp.]
MARYSFSSTERYAVYSVHGERCYLCGIPIDLKSMEVDHILPEALLKDPERLSEILEMFGLDVEFDLNSYANWMPACRRCNGKKRDTIFNPSPIVQIMLQQADEKAAVAKDRARETLSKAKLSRALNVLERANETGELNAEMRAALEPLVAFHTEHRDPELVAEPIRLTPLYEVLSDDGRLRVVKGPFGVGARPVGQHVDLSFNCPGCGAAVLRGRGMELDV